MKIAYLINQYPTPSHSFIRREIQALERRGVEVLRVAFRGWDIGVVDKQDEAERKRTKYVLKQGIVKFLFAVLRVLFTHPAKLTSAVILATRFAFNRSERPLLIHLIYVAEACQTLLWLRELGIQHIHAHFGTNSAEVAMLIHVLGGPTWSMTVHGPAEFDRKPLLNLPEKIERSNFVVAISSYGRSQLYRCVSHEKWSKIHVVRCGLESDFYQNATVTQYNSRRIVCVGRLSEPKGQLLLLQAVKLLHERGLYCELVLAGDGEMRAEIERAIAENELGDRVRLTGWISSEQVRSEILASAAMVLPSFAEGLPVVIMEAMALRRPVISTYVAGIPELVIPGQHGWLIPAGDVDALVQALQELLNTPASVLAEMGSDCRERVVAFHNVDMEAEKLHKLFQNVVK
jgi:glycosyltransferase involved in cell wall biosynthesis